MCNPVNGTMNVFTDHARNYFLGSYGDELAYQHARLVAKSVLETEMEKPNGDVDRAVGELAQHMKNYFLNGFEVKRNHRVADKGFTLVATDLMIAAIDKVDWTHIAEQFIQQFIQEGCE